MPIYLAGALLAVAAAALLSSVLGIGGSNVYLGSRQPTAVVNATPASSSPPSQFAVYVPPSPAATSAPAPAVQAAPPVAQPPPAAKPPSHGGDGHGGHHH